MPAPKPAILALADGSIFRGESIGANGQTVGEVVFNTAMTGYQEILTDPSYAQQIVTLTYPHIGNTGTTPQDAESGQVWAAGLVIRDLPLLASNWRNKQSLPEYLEANGTVAIAGIDTRRLTRILREKGAQNGCILAGEDATEERALELARSFPGLKGMDLAKEVSVKQRYEWRSSVWSLGTDDHAEIPAGELPYHVVAYDFGVKTNILRMLVARGCRITVLPAQTPASEALALNPDGVFLANGPGDPGSPADRDPGVRHLPGSPTAGAGLRREDREDAQRPPRRQPSGAGSEDRRGDDHQPEPRFRGGRGEPAGQRAGDPQVAVRRHPAGHRAYRQGRLQLPGSPGSEPRPA